MHEYPPLLPVFTAPFQRVHSDSKNDYVIRKVKRPPAPSVDRSPDERLQTSTPILRSRSPRTSNPLLPLETPFAFAF